MHPIHDFTSPYMMDERSSHGMQKSQSPRYEYTRPCDNVVERCFESQQVLHPIPYSIKDGMQIPGVYYGMYPYNERFPVYETPKMDYHHGRMVTYAQNMGVDQMYLPQGPPMDPTEPLITTPSGYEPSDANAIQRSSPVNNRSTPSLGSEGSPLGQATSQSLANMGKEVFLLDPGYANEMGCGTITPTNGRNDYNMTGYAYSDPNNSFGDPYNQTYIHNGGEPDSKSSDGWCQIWKTGNQLEYIPGTGRKGMAEPMMPKNPLMQTHGYSINADQYPGTVSYNINDDISRNYIYNPPPQMNCTFTPDETGYYEPIDTYVGMDGTDVIDSVMRNINIIRQDSSLKQRSSRSQPTYERSYSLPSHQEPYYTSSPLSTGRNTEAQEQEYEENEESTLEIDESSLSQEALESLKTMNRNEIDFLRMSDSLWQTLRSTGMFKLGNKGRAMLKSKISKQLKMNPKLRMRALCISGVRRATTRQLFQLAQICGIKSHLK